MLITKTATKMKNAPIVAVTYRMEANYSNAQSVSGNLA
jgi:hypothetical protein